MENLDIHIAVTHLSLAKNDKEWKKVRSENKHLTAEYKETIPYKVKWVGWGDPKQGDPHSERKAFPCQEEGCLKSFPSKVTAARHARWDKKSKQETQTLWKMIHAGHDELPTVYMIYLDSYFILIEEWNYQYDQA